MHPTKRRRSRRRYHHGDLANALVAAAVDIVQSQGAGALGLRAVARKVGVSHMAPYNHFDDRAALVAAVGARGFRKLAREIRESAEQFAGRPARQLQEAGITYVRFAVANPQLFRLMFSPELADKRAHPDLATAAQQTFGVLEDLVEQSAGTDARAQQAAMGPLVAWSLVHGLAVLLLDQQLGPPVDLQVAEQIARGATEAIWVGLAATTRERKSQP